MGLQSRETGSQGKGSVTVRRSGIHIGAGVPCTIMIKKDVSFFPTNVCLQMKKASSIKRLAWGDRTNKEGVARKGEGAAGEGPPGGKRHGC